MKKDRALLFDFDGLILDTETPSFEAWRTIFREQGADLAWQDYIQCVGTHNTAFDAVSHLEGLTGRSQARADLNQRHLESARITIEGQALLPGVVELLRDAERQNVKCAVASSSDRDWVEGHLIRLGIRSRFAALVSRRDVAKVKPAPDLFLKALDLLGVEARNAVVFEDSLNGIRAARAAGVYCVAVPNSVTRALPLEEADLLLPSLAVKSLSEILDLASRRGRD